MPETRVLVTGAGGFLGGIVCRELVHAGLSVRALTRRRRAPSLPMEVLAGDLGDEVALARAVDGVDAVVHLAARVHVMRESASDPLAAFRAVNVAGTQALLRAAAAAGVERFVFVSSVKAVGESSRDALSSRTEPAPGDPYGVSKLEAERAVLSAEPPSLQRAVLRLPVVYGPDMGGNMLRLFELVDKGVPLPLGRVANLRSIVYGPNVAAAILHLLGMPSMPTLPLFVSDDGDVSTPDLVRAIARALGRPAWLLPLPAAAIAALHVASAVGERFGVPSVRSALDRLTGSLRVDGREFQDVTGFRPPFTTAEGLAHTAAWFRTRARDGT